MTEAEIKARLQEIGTLPDDDLPVIETLLLMGAMMRKDVDLTPYRRHMDELHEALAAELRSNPRVGENILAYRLQALNKVVLKQFSYQGDHDFDSYDDPDKINLLNVIDRRHGIPVALGVLYFDLAQKQGWKIAGLNFPGHFLLRLEEGTHRAIIDPFHEGAELDAGKLRHLLKSILGPRAELHHHYYDAVTPRDIVLRFCNNRKTRLIGHGDYETAMETIECELWIAPHEPRLYFDAGVIAAKIERFNQAIEYLTEFVQLSQDTKTISEAREMIRSLQRKLH